MNMNPAPQEKYDTPIPNKIQITQQSSWLLKDVVLLKAIFSLLL